MSPADLFLQTTEILLSREEKIRQSWIGVMEARLVREELQKCWRTEGVNHYEQCHHLTAKYLDLLRTNRVSLPLSPSLSLCSSSVPPAIGWQTSY